MVKFAILQLLLMSLSSHVLSDDGLPYDIEQRMRAVEDPNYLEYLLELEQEIALHKEHSAEVKKQRQADLLLEEERRLEQVRLRKENAITYDEEALDREYEKNYLKEYKASLRADLEYEKEVEARERVESLALEQKIKQMRQMRMPANIRTPPERVVKKRRKF
jgi:hypothetical protein